MTGIFPCARAASGHAAAPPRPAMYSAVLCNPTALQVEKAGILGQSKIAEADLGPVPYLAMLLGQPDESVMRWFILAVALLLDPSAVLLLLAAAKTRLQVPRSTPGERGAISVHGGSSLFRAG
jgi:hypothetical protein